MDNFNEYSGTYFPNWLPPVGWMRQLAPDGGLPTVTLKVTVTVCPDGTPNR